MTFEEFEETYLPKLNHIAQVENPSPDPSSCAPVNGFMYETYGEEEAFIREQDPKHVWTVLVLDEEETEGEDMTWGIVAGFHHVNRNGYIITEKPWETGTEETDY